MGVVWDNSQYQNIPTIHQSFTFLESIPAGFKLAWDTLYDYVVSLKYLFNKEGVQQVGSFLTIGSLFPSAWDWHDFWGLTAFISIILAIIMMPLTYSIANGIMFGVLAWVILKILCGKIRDISAVMWVSVALS